MLTLIRPAESAEESRPLARGHRSADRVRRQAWRDLPTKPDGPRLRLVGSPGGEREGDEVLRVALDRLIEQAMTELNKERDEARRRLAGPRLALAQ